MSLIGAYLLLSAIALVGALAGGLAVAMRVAPYRGTNPDLPLTTRLAIFATTVVAALPLLAVFLGLIDMAGLATYGLLALTLGAGALMLIVPPARLPRSEPAILAALAVAAICAAATLFSASVQLRDARDRVHRACGAATDTILAERACRAHVDSVLSLPEGIEAP